MIPLTPALLVGAAHAFVGLGEQGGDNRGQMVELMLKEVHQPPGMPWCAAFVHHVGKWSHYDERSAKSSWPLPDTASCWELGEFADKRKKLVRTVAFGDVFLTYNQQLGRFAHTGIVAVLLESYPLPDNHWIYTCMTIEGNTNDDGSRNGFTTLRRTRRFNTFVGDRFIRWVEIDQQQQAV